MSQRQTITDYIFSVVGDDYGFREVSDMLKEGWQPWGTPIIIKDTVFQAFVKYQEKKNDNRQQETS